MSDADWAQFYQRYHRALIADVAGKRETARIAFAQAFKKNPATLRVADAYARHAVNTNNRKLAKQTLKTHIAKSAQHPLSTALLNEIEAGKTPPLLVTSPNDGLAEVFYGIGDALAGEGGLDMGIIFLQFALYLEPNFPLAQVALAEAYDSAKRYDLELAASRQYQRGFAALAERPDPEGARAELAGSGRRRQGACSKRSSPRTRRTFARSTRSAISCARMSATPRRATTTARAIALIGKPTKENWTLFYARGVCNERLKDWPEAEADLKKALELSPDESPVLNYLGYTWVDQSQNLKTAMDYIRKAVKLKPDDGYYIDSLGWAYYRLGNIQSAVEHLERAVELKPDDPVINDHLGDAYWRIGRKLEAKYQWQQSLTLKPDKDLIATIDKKLKDGLADAPATKAANSNVQKIAD